MIPVFIPSGKILRAEFFPTPAAFPVPTPGLFPPNLLTKALKSFVKYFENASSFLLVARFSADDEEGGEKELGESSAPPVKTYILNPPGEEY